jgi:hypothetical protein
MRMLWLSTLTREHMAKLNLYLSDDLKADMDAVSDLEPNWSAVAQEAFRLECQRLTNRKRSKGAMNEVIERLRKSKQMVENADAVEGHAAGRIWAMHKAQYNELKYAAEWTSDRCESDYWACFNPTGEEWSKREALEFWENVRSVDGYPSDAFVVAFAEAAEEVWDEVSQEI